MRKISPGQIKVLHTLKSKLGIEQDVWDGILADYKVTSSTQLSFENARELASNLAADAKQIGVWKDFERKRPAEIDGMATPGQKDMLRRIWDRVSRTVNPDDRKRALDKMVLRITGVSKLDWLPRELVSKVKKTLDTMDIQQSEKGGVSCQLSQK